MPLGFLKNIVAKYSSGPVDWDELEETLIRADLGVPMTVHLLDAVRKRGWEVNGETAAAICREEILKTLPPPAPPPMPLPDRPSVILVVGVNGTGKTTSSAKLARLLKSGGHGCLLVAADTFRAAAIEQLVTWGERLDIEVLKGQYGGDSAALCYDAWTSAHRRKIPYLICDTAGRLHTKNNLMQELSKVKRTLAKHDSGAPRECLLVVDATTGSNAIVQAKEFHEAVGLTGLIVTKLDGSGKGGALVAIQHELGIPTRYIGTGERPEDFSPFDREIFVNRIL